MALLVSFELVRLNRVRTQALDVQPFPFGHVCENRRQGEVRRDGGDFDEIPVAPAPQLLGDLKLGSSKFLD